MPSAAFLSGLLADASPAFVTAEDLDGPHGEALRAWQERHFIGTEPGLHPHPSCPHCTEGVPYRAAGRLICTACHAVVDDRELLAWPVHSEAFLTALAGHLDLSGGVRPIDGSLWELGNGRVDGEGVACFFEASGSLSPSAREHIAAYRRAVVFTPLPSPDPGQPGRTVPLATLLEHDGAFVNLALPDLLRSHGPVRFNRDTGALRVGTALVGELPVGSREWALLGCLAEQLDQFVPYRDLKRAVLRVTGGSGETDEATFCQKLKSRVKKEFIPDIDRLIVTSNKGDGYRMRAESQR